MLVLGFFGLLLGQICLITLGVLIDRLRVRHRHDPYHVHRLPAAAAGC